MNFLNGIMNNNASHDKQINVEPNLRQKYFTKAEKLEKTGEIDKSIYYFRKCLLNLENEPNFPYIAKCLRSLSTYYWNSGNVDKSLKFIEAERLYYQNQLDETTGLERKLSSSDSSVNSLIEYEVKFRDDDAKLLSTNKETTASRFIKRVPDRISGTIPNRVPDRIKHYPDDFYDSRQRKVCFQRNYINNDSPSYYSIPEECNRNYYSRYQTAWNKHPSQHYSNRQDMYNYLPRRAPILANNNIINKTNSSDQAVSLTQTSTGYSISTHDNLPKKKAYHIWSPTQQSATLNNRASTSCTAPTASIIRPTSSNIRQDTLQFNRPGCQTCALLLAVIVALIVITVFVTLIALRMKNMSYYSLYKIRSYMPKQHTFSDYILNPFLYFFPGRQSVFDIINNKLFTRIK